MGHPGRKEWPTGSWPRERPGWIIPRIDWKNQWVEIHSSRHFLLVIPFKVWLETAKAIEERGYEYPDATP